MITAISKKHIKYTHNHFNHQTNKIKIFKITGYTHNPNIRQVLIIITIKCNPIFKIVVNSNRINLLTIFKTIKLNSKKLKMGKINRAGMKLVTI